MFVLDKPVGPTAAQALAALRSVDLSLVGVKLGHAGRLDPMAEGLLTVLVGEETRDVHAHRSQPKTYEIDVLFGVATDSFDELGLVTALAPTAIDGGAIERECAAFVGPYVQRYPPFSQARVDGRSLIALSRAGVVVERPTAEREVYEITLLGVESADGAAVSERARRRVALVRGDFRQGAIADRWAAAMEAHRASRFTVASLRVHCSAGTYMRALADDLGAAMGVPAVASRIRRTRAGGLTLEGARALECAAPGNVAPPGRRRSSP